MAQQEKRGDHSVGERGAQFDVIVIGAGAAGLMCAMTAGARGRRVLLLEHASEPGKKILISGGGRCNFTNLNCAPRNFLSANRHFAKSALARYTQHDFIALVGRHRIPWHEKTLGQLFCDGSARAVVAMLLADVRRQGFPESRGGFVTEALARSLFQFRRQRIGAASGVCGLSVS